MGTKRARKDLQSDEDTQKKQKTANQTLLPQNPERKAPKNRTLAPPKPTWTYRRTTRSMTKTVAPPEHAIWGVPELLGQIISCLPVRDIFTQAQRVSKFWKAVIDSTPVIQTKLWMKAESSHVVSPSGFSNSASGDHWLVHPRLNRALPIYPGALALNTLFLFSKGARLWEYDPWVGNPTSSAFYEQSGAPRTRMETGTLRRSATTLEASASKLVQV